ncbi:TERF1-interacting nuclear factor 2 [Polymixia lowei]
MATRKPTDDDISLPFNALQLLAPPMRLVSAALWKVMKQRDVLQYGTVEEFVTSACDTVPGLLTVRHQGKLTLGLRARLTLELCRGQDQPDPKVVSQHLERIRAPAPSSAHKLKKDMKIEKTVSNFQELVQTLLSDPTEREYFFKEEFPVEYGPRFDQELEKLLWEFLIRLDQLLMVPNLAQTVSWLSTAPPVLEECARAATQPQLLRLLLQHQTCLGHLESAASLPPNMGDSILTSLSLPLSGRAASNRPTGSGAPSVGDPGVSRPVPGTNRTQTRHETPFITPVIGLISNEDVPVMISANKRNARDEQPASTQDATNENLEPTEKLKLTMVKQRQKSKEDGMREDDKLEVQQESGPKKTHGMKRKLTDKRETESDEEEREEETPQVTRNRRKRMRKSVKNSDGDAVSDREDPTGVAQLGLSRLKLPEHPSLRSVFTSCLRNQPKVVITRVETSSEGSGGTSAGASPPHWQLQGGGTESPVTTRTHGNMRSNPRRLELELPDLDDKENSPVFPGKSSSSSLQRRNTEAFSPPGDSEDFICDSEDEATKNFKGRLFVKRYYKTKHDTYVPTLREFCKPWMARRNLLSPGNGQR